MGCSSGFSRGKVPVWQTAKDPSERRDKQSGQPTTRLRGGVPLPIANGSGYSHKTVMGSIELDFTAKKNGEHELVRYEPLCREDANPVAPIAV